MLYEGFEVLGRALFCLKLGYTALILGFCVALDLIDLLIYYVCVCVYMQNAGACFYCLVYCDIDGLVNF